MSNDTPRRIAVIDHAGSSSWARSALLTLAAGSLIGVPVSPTRSPRPLVRRVVEPEPKKLPAPPTQDARNDKYLHAAARRRRRASLQPKDTPDV